MTDAFLDTNVLIYLLTDDPKNARAFELARSDAVISVQVLNEFTSVARRKHALSWDDVARAVAGFRAYLQVEPVTVDVHERALEIARRHRFSIYDACIIAVAEKAGCRTLYTEDMQHGQVIGGVTIRNPFLDA
ncbi:PIN domain-containing protein [Phenylobacterium sp.]|uniref:PIN domain-containing protein n=1 Tax=Phenylobacterium sp. TaxID=1871053 RepID=UPI0037C5BD5F